MIKPLIDLTEVNYIYYNEMINCINEFFITPKQEEEVNRILERLKNVNSDLDNKKITKNTREEIQSILDDLDATSDEVKNRNIKGFKAILIATELVKLTLNIIKIVGFVRKIIGDIKEANVEIDPDKITEEDIENNKTLKDIIKDSIKNSLTKESIINSIKNFFSVKSLLIMALKSINKLINKTTKRYLEYEKNIDKYYELLLNAEAKVMIDKRKAKENKDKYTEECCDKMIEYIEKFKKDRVRERVSSTNESVLQEYSGNEYNINTFRLVIQDLSNALAIEEENLRAYCNGSLYIIRRSLEINKDNYKDKITLMTQKISKIKDFVDDVDRKYDKDTIDMIFHKYGNMFSVKYSSYGLEVRKKFEEKLSEYAKSMFTIIESYYKDAIDLLYYYSKSADTSTLVRADSLAKIVENNSTTSVANTCKRLYNEIDDDCRKTFDMCNEYIKWCKDNLKTQFIKNSIGYKILNSGLFK